MTIAQLNQAGRDEFIDAVGFVYEDSPWIAAAAWERRPYSGIEDLHRIMSRIVAESPEAQQVALIAAHPDLAGRLAREGRLTAASTGEQRAAGLDRLTPPEVQRFNELNAAYRERFGFPFVICARENTKETMLQALESRGRNARAAEIATALGEISKIARLRLASVVNEG